MTNQDLSNFSMLDLFRMEVETQAAILNDNLLELETQPDATEALASLMRAAHSIKGAARIVQVEPAVKVAHVMEDCFVAAQQGSFALSSDQIDILLQGVDLLLRIAQVPETDAAKWVSAQKPEVETVVAAISTIFEQGRGDGEMASSVVGAGLAHNLSAPQTTFPPNPPSSGEQGNTVVGAGLAHNLSAPQTTFPPNPPSSGSSLSTQGGTPRTAPTALNREAESSIQNPKLRSRSASEGLSKAASVARQPKIQNNTDRSVRVSGENLNRLMGLAGESLVEANWLHAIADSMQKLKWHQNSLSKDLEKLQELLADLHLNQSIEDQLSSTRQKANECYQILAEHLSELELFTRRSANLSDRLYREVIATQMRPFADGVEGFPRMVRDLAKQLGKQVKFEIRGKSTQVDRDILEKLEAPLIHILRNAIDHGIESPQERLSAGKPAEGTVQLEASHQAGMLSITVSDDGRGVDLEQLRQKVASSGMVNAEIAAQLTEAELMEFLFLPGFSTANAVTEISGRGVGLDIVQSIVQQVGGVLRAVSQPGRGMRFHLQLPLTLSVIRALLVEISGEAYAFALTRIDRLLMVPKAEVAVVENRQFFTVDEQNVGLVAAHQVLDLPESTLFSHSEAFPVVIISERSSSYGLVVDKFLGARDLVVRPLDPRLGKVQDISAAALMEDNSIVLIVDVEDLFRSIDKLLAAEKISKVGHTFTITSSKQPKRILVVDDSITVREVERKLLENNGYQVEVAVNGIDAWNAVCTEEFDLVITDVDMPRLNGIELVNQMKNHPGLKSVPVIIVSYKDREEDYIKGLDVGANYYLTKSSFHDDTLVNAVIDLIGN